MTPDTIKALAERYRKLAMDLMDANDDYGKRCEASHLISDMADRLATQQSGPDPKCHKCDGDGWIRAPHENLPDIKCDCSSSGDGVRECKCAEPAFRTFSRADVCMKCGKVRPAPKRLASVEGSK